ncbi:ATP synthase F0 subunit C [Candidatus Babeliales bacterium]|nr:ATP synthase F0 subunit C [Candidatus Babeliales bacterium]
MLTPQLLHYFSIGLTVALGSIGTGIGQGIGAFSAIGTMARQKEGNDKTFKTMVIGLAFIESGVILALVIALLTLFGTAIEITWPIALVELGIALAIGFSASAISIASSFAVKSSCESIARQPFFSQKIVTIMLLSQSIIEAPVVFAFIICLIIRGKFSETLSIFEGIKLFAASFCIAIGCIGPSCGQAIFAHSSCRSVGLNKEAYGKIFTFSMVNQAIIETPLIFCLLSSILIIYNPLSSTNPIGSSIGFFSAALCIALGAFGTALAAGFVGSKSCYEIAIEPKNYGILFRSNILAIAFIESAAIYTLIITLSLITKTY